MSQRSVPQFQVSKQFDNGDLVGGRYRLIRRIGAGAMGTVWFAHNELLAVDVAVKVLRVDNRKADANQLYRKLLHEARAAARLGHSSIVRIFDFGQTDDGSPYIVMELLAGESLAELLARQPKLEVTAAVQLVLPLMDAMASAHGRGIVHRDLKPENIFLAKDEYGRMTPKVVDFGVARFAEGGRASTRSGVLLGTPDYMAPEQARGEPNIDLRVDVWALCILLYELITGRRPFARDAGNYLAVLRAIVQEPAPSILKFGVGDADLWRILERGLRKRRTDRWETMRSLGQALALWLYERGVREDAIGASLKTTWLQAGLDGVKIETPSMLPPPGGPEEEPGEEKDAAEALLASAPPVAPTPTVHEAARRPKGVAPPRPGAVAAPGRGGFPTTAIVLVGVLAFGAAFAIAKSRHAGARAAPSAATPPGLVAVSVPAVGPAAPAAAALAPTELSASPEPAVDLELPANDPDFPAPPAVPAAQRTAPTPHPGQPAGQPRRPPARSSRLPSASTYDFGF